jgi:hypothetical protein
MVELRKFPGLGVRQYGCEPFHCQRDCSAITPPSVQEQYAGRYFSVVLVTTVEAGNLPPFAQVLLEETQHLAILVRAPHKYKYQQLHQPPRRSAYARRGVSENKLHKRINALLGSEILLVAGHPIYRHGPVNGHAGFVDGYLAEI